MKKEIFNGVCTAIVTPFKQNGQIDYKAFNNLINIQIKNDIDAILVLGTTGEGSTISNNERKKIITLARRLIKPPTKLIVGTGSNNTKTALRFTKQAQHLKADGVLIVTPYYNKCSQNGAIEHYNYIANNSNIPIIVYNVPSRTGFNLNPETTAKIVEHPNIVGIKEACDNIEHINKLLTTLANKTSIYSGTDSLNHYFVLNGGKGFISVLSNIEPKLVKDLYQKCLTGNHQDLVEALDEYSKNLFVDVNPIPVKYVLSKQDLINYNLRLPLTKTSKENEKILNNTFNLNN